MDELKDWETLCQLKRTRPIFVGLEVCAAYFNESGCFKDYCFDPPEFVRMTIKYRLWYNSYVTRN